MGAFTNRVVLEQDRRFDFHLPNSIPSPMKSPVRSVTAKNNVPIAQGEHVVQLSSIEHCMPRAYIRVCLAFRVVGSVAEAISRLEGFVRRLVDAKPYLAGYIVPERYPGSRPSRVEIRFTDEDFISCPTLNVRHFDASEMPFSYDELDWQGLPPSAIRPDLVSALSEGADDASAPVFRVQANVVDGGLITSFYLHHCISDGTGLGLLISGSVLRDDFSFDRSLADTHSMSSMTERLAAHAGQKSFIKGNLSWSSPNSVSTRHIGHKYFTITKGASPPQNAPGRGLIFTFPNAAISMIKESLQSHLSGTFITDHDVLEAFLWHHATQARIPSLQHICAVVASKLLIPINIRAKLKPPLQPFYFGSAVDFTSVTQPLTHLSGNDPATLAATALSIRKAVQSVDDEYVRSAIALANSPDPTIDVRDLLASNMNRVTGADMYITSWANLPLYTADLGMGLGPPDWVRKPWSRDPGSCIILPKDPRKDHLEVVVQMTEPDISRLLKDEEFMKSVTRVIE